MTDKEEDESLRLARRTAVLQLAAVLVERNDPRACAAVLAAVMAHFVSQEFTYGEETRQLPEGTSLADILFAAATTSVDFSAEGFTRTKSFLQYVARQFASPAMNFLRVINFSENVEFMGNSEKELLETEQAIRAMLLIEERDPEEFKRLFGDRFK